MADDKADNVDETEDDEIERGERDDGHPPLEDDEDEYIR